MKLKNELIVICFILFILISVSAVSAADNNAEIITVSNNDNSDIISINNSNTNELLTGTNDGSFADLNTKINGGSSTNIVLDRNYVYSTGNDKIKDGIVISKDNITIDGKGHTIDAKGQSRIFNITGTTVYLKNIIFTNGKSENGGAIRGYGDNLRIYNCTFIKNTATSWGGAVFSYPTTYAAIVNSTFINNNAKYGGAVSTYNHITDYYDTFTTYGNRHDIVNCTFDSNTATSEGGSLGIMGQLQSEKHINNDRVNIRGCVFTNNKAPKGDSISNMLSAYINMTDSIILGNNQNTIYSWGAMFFADNNWWGNAADNKDVKPNITDNVRFTKWLYMDFVPDVSSSSATVSINNIYDGETAKTSTYSTTRLPSINVKFTGVNATFDADNADLDNTGKYEASFNLLGDATLTANIEGIKISKKIKIGGLSELAALIRNTDDDKVIKLQKDYVYVPGIDAANRRSIILSDRHNLVIDGNGHTINGMGKTQLFSMDKDSSDITFMNMKIVNGYSNDEHDGPAGYILGVNTKFLNCTFADNTAEGISTGGALHINAMNTSIIDCKFINNTHKTSSAGAVYIRGEGANIINTLFENNTADAYHARSGALLLYDGGNLVNCTFMHNTADYAGAVFNYGATTIDDCTFMNNIALSDTLMDEDGSIGGAGAIYAGDATITNSRFINNTAIAGSAMIIGSPSASADRCVFINNTANSPNGIVLGVVAGGSVTNSIFLNNNVAYGGYHISTIYGKLKADYNWFGNLAKNYNTNWFVSNLAEMSKWVFLNATTPKFSDDGKYMSLQFNFFIYDSNTKQSIRYDSDNLPEFNFTISAQNLTLAKNTAAPEETIGGNLTYHVSIGEEGYVYRYDYKGTLTAQYENVKYVVPFSYEEDTWFESNSTFELMKDEIKYLDFTLHPFDGDYLPFLNSAGRLTYTINDTSIISFNKTTGRIKGLKVGLATISIKFDGKDVMGRDKYLPSNTTILVNVTKAETHIHFNLEPPEHLLIGETAQISASVYDYKNKSVRYVSLDYVNHNPELLKGAYSLFKGIEEGLAKITVKFDGNDDYLPCSEDIYIEVGRLNPHLKVEPNNIDMKKGSIYYVAVSCDASSDLTYTSSNPNVAIMDGNAVYGIGEGTANITISYAGSNKYLPATAYLIVSVTAVKTYIDVNKTINMIPADVKYIGASVRDSDGKLVGYSMNYASSNPNVITIDEYGQMTSYGEGVSKITITYDGRGEYLPSKAEVTVKVAKGKSEISADSNVELPYRQSANLNAKLNHPGELSYKSSNESVVSVDSKGRITANKIGEATITISFNETNQYRPATKTVKVKVVRAPTSINVDKTFACVIDYSGVIDATLSPRSAGSLTYRSNDESIVKINDGGELTAVGIGKTTVLVSFAGNENYLASRETVEVTVYQANMPTSIDVNRTFDLHVGDVVDMEAVLNPSNAGKLNFVSSNSDIVSVDENGKITAKKVGEATITVSFAGNNRFLANSTKVNVKVTLAPSVISVDPAVEIPYNQQTNLNATLNHDGKLTYKSSNSNIVSVDDNGLITAKNIGEATITVSYQGSAKYAPATTDVKVNVTKAPSKIDVGKTFALLINSNGEIVATLNPNVGTLTFKSNDENIVKVDNDGKISTTNRVGKTTVLISFAGNANYLPANETVEVSVWDSDIPTSIEVNKTFDLHIEDIIDMGAVLNPSNAGKLNYASSNPGVVSVDENGTLTAKTIGEANVTISFAQNGVFLACSTNVTVKVTASTSKISVNTTVEIPYKQQTNLNATLNHEGKLTYKSSNSNVVSVDEYGNITANRIGEATITITYAGNGKFASNSTKVNVKVTKAPTSIDVEKSFALIVENKAIIEAALNPDVGTLIFKSNNESIVKVDSKGKITAVAVGKTTITVRFVGNNNYMAATEDVEVTVYPIEIPTSIEVNKTFDLHVDDSINIGAVLNPANAGKLTYESSNPNIVTVDNNGKIIAKKIGQATITVSFAGNDKYVASSADVLVNVSLIHTSITASDVKVNLTENAKLDYTFSDYRAGQLKYIFADVNIASISNGWVTGEKVGKTTLTIKFEGNNKYAASNVTVNVIVSDVETTIDADDSIEVNVTQTAEIIAKLIPKQTGKLRFVSNNNDIVSVNGNGIVYGIKLGNATITVIFDGEGKYRSSNKTINVVVKDVEPVIDVNDTVMVNVTETASIAANVIPKDAGILKYTTDSDIISIDSKGNVKGLKVGNATVTLSLSANGKYRATSKTITVIVSDVETDIKLDIGDINLVYGDETEINATLTPDVGKLAFESNDTGVVTVDENGVVKTVKPGVAAITISYDGEGKYKAVKRTVLVTVERAPSSIEINDTMDMEIGIGYSLRPNTNPSNIKLNYSSSNTDVLMVNDSFVFPVQYGTAVLTIDFAGDEYYLPSNAIVNVTVKSVVTEIQVNDSITLGYGDSKGIGAKIYIPFVKTAIDGDLIYVSANPGIASVDEKTGLISANDVGNTTITVIFKGTKIYEPSNATVDVEVTTRTTNVKVVESSVKMYVDDTQNVNATLENGPEGARLNYISGNSSIVRINPLTGEMTAVAEGSTTITIAYPGDDDYHSSSATVTVTVSKIKTQVKAKTSYEMLVNDKMDLNAVVMPNEGKLTYTSSDEDVVSVDANGCLSAKKAGSAIVTIRFEGDRKYLPSQKEVIVEISKIPTSINLTDISLFAGEEYKLGKIVSPDGVPTRAKYYEYTSWDLDVFEVDNGVVSAVHEGSAELYVGFLGDDTYLPSNITVMVNVAKRVISADEYNITVEVDDDAGEVKFTLTLPEDAEGSFTVKIGNDIFSEPIFDGQAIIVVDDLEPGDYKATLSYGGDQKYAGFANNTKFRIGKYKIDKNKDVDVLLGSTAKYTVHLTKDTQAMENKTIKFRVNGKTYYAVTNKYGYASIKVKLPAMKSYKVTAQYGSIKVSNKIKVHVIKAKDLKTSKRSDNLKVKVTLKKVNKKYLANKKVTLKFNGKTYTGNTNKKGAVTFTLKKSVFAKLKAGKTYNYTVKYSTDKVTKTIKLFK